MSCTVMYQPYAMSSYSTCDRPSSDKKSFRFPYVPSPPDSLHSDGSSYSSPGPSSGGTNSSSTSTQPPNRRPLTPSCLPTNGGGLPLLSSPGVGASAPATITSSSLLLQQQKVRSPPSSLTPNFTSNKHHSHNHQNLHHHHHHHHHHNLNHSSIGGGNASSAELQRSTASAASTSSSASTSQSTHLLMDDTGGGGTGVGGEASGGLNESGSGGGNGTRAQYLSANCVVYESYRGDAARVVEEHFSRALSAAYSSEKGAKCSPMTSRNFPPSFWNSHYQPSKPLVGYGASEFYGAAVDYGPSLSGLAHHHQTDPWHYPLASHQGYHHRPTDLSYPPMPSTSRFNAAQYGSFLLAGAAASSSASRFPVMPGSGQCGVKGEAPSTWPSGRYHHSHDSLSELHLADYSAAAAAHYSMTAGLETTVGQESSSKDLYWF